MSTPTVLRFRVGIFEDRILVQENILGPVEFTSIRQAVEAVARYALPSSQATVYSSFTFPGLPDIGLPPYSNGYGPNTQVAILEATPVL